MARCAEGLLREVEVAVHELQHLQRGRRFILGGDLTSVLLMDEVDGTGDNRRLFDPPQPAGSDAVR